MIPKSGFRFSEKVMRKQCARAGGWPIRAVSRTHEPGQPLKL